jgi:hypothetical protein
VAPVTGATGGSFVVPTTGETSANVWYRIHLTVEDSSGLTHSTYRDVLPRTVTLQLQTTPPGLQITLDGQPLTAPHSAPSVTGMVRSIGAVSPQTSGPTTYTFSAWSDGGASTHTISTPSVNTTYTASYAATATATVTFDDRAGQNQVLTGQYPAGLIDWGSSSNWYHSAPYGLLTTKNVTFNGPAVMSASFTFVTPRQLLSVQAYNGGSAATVTLSCPGQASKVQPVAANQLLTITTGWTGTCTAVTMASSNGWDTNFDNLVVATSVPDTTPPTANITSPAPGTVSGIVNFSASASDSGGISKVRFWAGAAYLGFDTSAPYSKTWDTTLVPNGNYALTIQAFDTAGNTTTRTVSVTVVNADPTPPTASITSPAPGDVSGSVAFSASASDAGGIAKVRFWAGSQYLGFDTSAPYGKTWDTTAGGNGRVRLKIEAIDFAGNSTTRMVTVTVKNPDTTPPVVSVSSPGTGTTVSGVVTLGATATDDLGVEKVRFWVDGTYLGFDTTAPYSRSWDTAAFPDGTHTITAQAVDWLGNTHQAAITVTVAN